MSTLPVFNPSRIRIPRYEKAGVPVRAFVISNSERMEMGCDRRWFFRYGERLAPHKEVRALRYGSAWAEVMEDLHRWWMVHDAPYPFAQVLQDGPSTEVPKGSCPWCQDGHVTDPETGVKQDCSFCDGNDLSRPFLILADWRQDQIEGRIEDAEGEAEVLFNALIGYRAVYGDSPPADYRVVAVEQEVAGPILTPEGKPFRSKIPLVEDGSIWRLARPGETPTTWAILPWFQVGKLDVVLQNRATGVLWVQDAKSSRDPAGYLRNITVDPQTTGYVWMLDEALRQGLLGFQGEIGGVQFDVASSSKQSRPERLVEKELAKKDPGREKGFTHHPPAYSKAKNRTTPSWLYADTLRDAPPGPDGQGVNLDDYREHIDFLREEVDPKLYVREPLAVSPSGVEEYRLELYGIALQLSEKIRGLPASTPEMLPATFPRTPLCRKPGGSCPFTALCSGSTGAEVYDDFTVLDGLTWEKSAED